MGEGLVAGVRARTAWAKAQVSASVNEIVGGVEDTLGIRSPSKVFAAIGAYMARGLAEGFTKTMARAGAQIAQALPDGAFSVDVAADLRAAQKRLAAAAWEAQSAFGLRAAPAAAPGAASSTVHNNAPTIIFKGETPTPYQAARAVERVMTEILYGS
jgi:hypothetical protein